MRAEDGETWLLFPPPPCRVPEPGTPHWEAGTLTPILRMSIWRLWEGSHLASKSRVLLSTQVFSPLILPCSQPGRGLAERVAKMPAGCGRTDLGLLRALCVCVCAGMRLHVRVFLCVFVYMCVCV